MKDIRKLPEYDIEISQTVDLIEGRCVECIYVRERDDVKIVFDNKLADKIIQNAIDGLYEQMLNKLEVENDG